MPFPMIRLASLASLAPLASTIALAAACSAHAAISADEARALGSTLTAIGAEKAANKDGTIPAYSGGLTTPPAGYKAGDGIRPNPFAADKPRLVIDAKNLAQHAEQLTEGSKALIQKYPSYRIDVYPTQRSVAFPKFVAENTAKNSRTVGRMVSEMNASMRCHSAENSP